MIIQGSPEILQGPRGLNNQFGAFAGTEDTVVQLYQQILQRTPSASEIAYWSAGWGPTVEASEIADFQRSAEPERIAADAWRAQQAAIAAAAAQQAAAAAAQQAAAQQAAAQQAAAQQAAAAAAAAQQAAIEAANRKAVADAYAAAQEAARVEKVSKTEIAAMNRAKAIAAVQMLYLQVLGREGEQTGLDYFADKFGTVIEPEELQIFSDMAKPEIDARNAYLADMAKKSSEDAAKAKAIADEFKRVAEDAKKEITTMPVDMCPDGYYYFMGACVRGLDPVEVAEEATADGCPPGYAFDGKRCRPTGLTPPPTTSGAINPALILAAAAAAFFIGG